jgi:hypothetical protein
MLAIAAGVSAQENWGPPRHLFPESWWEYYGYGLHSPSITPNDSMIFFTYWNFDSTGIAFSRRADTSWTAPEYVPTGMIQGWASSYFDAADSALYFSTDDSTNYVEIFVTRLLDGQWTPRENIGAPVNTQADESCPSLTADGSRLYFIRGETIMYSDRVGGQFQEPMALPELINSSHTEGYPRISPDGNRLYFNRRIGDYFDFAFLYVSYFNGQWQEPIRLNENINPERRIQGCETIPPGSFAPAFSLDGSKMYFSFLTPVPPWCDPGYVIMVSDLIVGVEENAPELRDAITLAAYPNPFNGATTITVDGAGVEKLEIYDIAGREVEALRVENGRVVWEPEGLGSEVYFARTAGGKSSGGIKLIYLK